MTPNKSQRALGELAKEIAAVFGLMITIFTVLEIFLPTGLVQPLGALVIGLVLTALLACVGKWNWGTMLTTWLAVGIVLIILYLIVSRPATVVGAIVDSGGSPVAGLRLVLTDSDGVDHKAVTDENGAFEIRNVPEGKFTVLANGELLINKRVSSGWERIIDSRTEVGALVHKPGPAATATPVVVAPANTPTATPIPPTNTPASPTYTPVSEPPTDTPVPPTTAPTVPPVAGIDCMGAAAGDKVTLLYQWSGAEEGKFAAVVNPLVDACGIVLEPESSRDQTLMDTRIKAGRPWDVVIWPTTLALAQYPDKLVSLEEAGADPANYADYWKAMGSADGKWLAMPVKVDIKNIIWYSPAVFETNGYEVPNTWEELDALVEKMVADGNVPWSMGMESGEATGWTASDFIQDILLVQQGPQYVLDIISGKVPYNDMGVKKAYETYGKWAKDPKYTVGGAKGTVNTSFLDAIYKPFSEPPEAMMVRQAGFAITEIQKMYPDLEYGVDCDFFSVPGAKGMQGTADFLMVFNASPAAKALVAYLNSEAGALEWAWVGFDLSPNNKVTGVDYLDAVSAKEAKVLAGAAGFTPDLGDAITGSFGHAEWEAIIDYINGADLDKVLAKAARAYAESTQ